MCFSFSLNIYLSILLSLRHHTRLLPMSRPCALEKETFRLKTQSLNSFINILSYRFISEPNAELNDYNQ